MVSRSQNAGISLLSSGKIIIVLIFFKYIVLLSQVAETTRCNINYPRFTIIVPGVCSRKPSFHYVIFGVRARVYLV